MASNTNSYRRVATEEQKLAKLQKGLGKRPTTTGSLFEQSIADATKHSTTDQLITNAKTNCVALVATLMAIEIDPVKARFEQRHKGQAIVIDMFINNMWIAGEKGSSTMEALSTLARSLRLRTLPGTSPSTVI